MTPRTRSLPPRSLLLASAVPALWLAGFAAPAALAVDISDDRTEPVATSTAGDGGTPDDVTIVSGGSVELEDDDSTAVTVDSDNDLTLNTGGSITISDADGATGVRVLGGFTGTITNNGSIRIDDTTERTDTDGDGTLDGPLAQGTGRTGILIEGSSSYVGDIRNGTSGAVVVEGNDSVGISLQTDLDGSMINQGSISVTGANTIALDINGNVSGDVRLMRSVGARGDGATAVRVAGDVGGGFSNGGSITATGFQYSSISNYYDPDNVPDGYEPVPLDEDDLNDGGPAVAIGGSVAEGVLNNGPVGGGDADDDEDGNDDVKDISGDFDENRSTGSITAFGSAPAVIISPDYAPDGTGDVVIGLVVEKVRDTTDDDEDDDTDEVLTTFMSEHGFVNRGTISANGLNIGFDATTIVIRGSTDGTRSTQIEGGILNTGAITSVAYEADANTMLIGDGASAPRLDNEGGLTGNVYTEGENNVTVLLIEADAMLSALTNSGAITASAIGDAGSAVAIRDLSGTLLSITNTGGINAVHILDNDDDDDDGSTTDLDERTGETVAIDLSTHAAGQNVTITQERATPTEDLNGDGEINEDDVADPALRGDIRLGAGDDEFQLLAGIARGDLSFGAGADMFTIDGGATYTGHLTDSDGQLSLTVADGTMNLTGAGDLAVTDLTLGDGSSTTLALSLEDGAEENTRIVASNTIDIAGGAEIAPQFTGLGGLEETAFEIMRAGGGVTLTDGQDISTNLSIDSPFLFDASIEQGTDGGDDIITINVRRRSATELGMNDAQAAAYEPVVAALNGDDELLVAIANITDSDQFFSAYNQLLPEYTLAALQFAVANTDGAIGAVGNRLDVVRGGRDGVGGAWMQEFGVFIDRDKGDVGGAYRGQGFGIAGGVDRPFGPFYAVGVNFVGAASEIDESDGFDQPMAVSSAQLGAYAAAELGGFLLDVYGGGGVDFFNTEREVIVEDPITEDIVIRNAEGDWTGTHAAASARLAYDMRRGHFFARPAVSVDYLQLSEDSYEETGDDAIRLAISQRDSDMVASTATLTLGGYFGSQSRTWWSPRLRVGYRSESSGAAALTNARFVGAGEAFTLDAGDLPDSGGLFGFTFAAGSRYSSFALDYDADVRDGFIRHGARVAFRFVF